MPFQLVAQYQLCNHVPQFHVIMISNARWQPNWIQNMPLTPSAYELFLAGFIIHD
jgi:hypothetical protein